MKAKQRRISFESSDKHSDTLFELMHVDVWGPYNQLSFSGVSYFLTIVDDKSRCTWTYLMQNKAQTGSLLEKFIRMITKQFDAKIKTIRSDNGGEFLASTCQNVFTEFGIIHHTTCPYFSQQS